ncbi:MAG: AAA family ATPase [Candidatus Rokubacteria bacterium]|nr:AAA family ATPase [Candidatus Rokubacteria bacterium]
MQCPACRAENLEDRRFCSRCGAALSVVCGGCGAGNEPAARFCGQCGAALDAAGGPAFRRSPVAAHLVRRVLASRLALEGERKLVTVLFADVRGSMELLADRDPEEARALLDPVIDRMIAAVQRYEGTVNQVMGDGIMALFGAPLAQEDHAVRACHAALEMQATVRRWAEEAPVSTGLPVRIRIGLNSGEVVVRSIRSDLHVDYTAVGQTTHLAARMEQQADPGTIRVTAETAALLGAWMQVTPLGPVPVRGLDAPVRVYELTGLGPARSRLHAALARGVSHLVGRDHELAELAHAATIVRNGHGQIVALVGEAGVGKSRLTWEFLHSASLAGWRIVQGAASPYERSAYALITQVLRQVFEVDEAAAGAALRDKVDGTLAVLPGLADLAAPLLVLLGDAAPNPAWEVLELAARRRRLIDAVRRLLVGLSRLEPLSVVLEDLQWNDRESALVLDALVDAVATSRILLLVTARPGPDLGWSGKAHYGQIGLAPLSRSDADELLRDLLGDRPESVVVRRMVAERTQGNPFFIEESVRNLADLGVLEGGRGRYSVRRAPPSLQLPVSVHDVLAARIDRLQPEDKLVLQAASVIGREVPMALLDAVAEDGDAVARLHAAELIDPDESGSEPKLVFRHALTQEVAYGGLLRERRRELDARLVDALERRPAGRLDEPAERLAYHALRGELWDKAARYCRQAGTRAIARCAYRAAVLHFEDALAALARLPPGRDRGQQTIEVHLELRTALTPQADFGRMLEHLQEAERLAREIDDRERLARVSSFLANQFTVMLDFPRAIRYGREALDLARALGDLAIEVITNAYLGVAYYTVARYDEAAELCRRNVVLLDGERAMERFGMMQCPAVYSRTVLAWSLAETGAFGEGLERAEEGVALGHRIGHPVTQVFAWLGLGVLHHRRRDYERAVSLLEQALAHCQAAEAPVYVALITAPLAASLARVGRVHDAVQRLEAGIEQAIAIGDPYGRWLRTGGLAEAYLLSGRTGDAVRLARRAVELTRLVQSPGAEVHATVLLAETLLESDPHEASEHVTRAIARAAELGMRPAQAWGHVLESRALARLEKAEQAQAALARAEAMFEAMAMRLE